ncbi:hypothetical protein I302_108396 [Kwoniella bestiolae CBS 10118]|uniref:25S rRNA (uridine-N(3))-methyltransferase BMT5-like domain-containing protein n=1 Tax=Kwoniella bestiolae CBS 10118 TaxID=1296100 RepID=A0A1B9FVU2_9TREE|nr:hypothetical protein I302_07230 [Kwoniella bestiolae CBS 10118]OCF22883.1 hypothetical protein I302_07230 [Kwoniella bestiolae CBS 10118]
MAKLKAALASQQHSAAKAAAKKRAQQFEESKKQSIKASLSGSRKGEKRKSKLSLKDGLSQKSSPQSIANGPGERETSTMRRKLNPNQRPVIPFQKDDSILLLGEGNFSFSLSLLYPPHNFHGSQILATAYDTEEVTYKKYPDASDIVKELREKNVRVEFGVDATGLDKVKCLGKGRRWSRVVFNFPHVGAGITDQDRNILTNQHMLLKFFKSVEPLLTGGPPSNTSTKKSKSKGKGKNRSTSDDEDEDDREEEEESPYILNDDDLSSLPITSSAPKEMSIPTKQGSILITLLSCPPYSLWSLPKLATKPPTLTPGTKLLQPRYDLVRSFEFHPELYSRYEHRRTIGWKEGLSKGGNEEIRGRKGMARTWEFVRRSSQEDE